MKRAYDDEAFLPWYRRPSPTWLELSAAARGVLVSVAMELSQKKGEIVLRRGLSSLAVLVRIPWDILEPALAELIAVGKLEWDGSHFVLRDPEYLDRARPTSKERVARHREARLHVVDAIREEDQTRREEKRREVTLPALHPDTVTAVTPVTLQALHDPPGWFGTTLDVIEMATGEKLDPAPCWLRYRGHRAKKGEPMSERDAEYWLTSVVVPELKRDREEKHHRKERDQAFDNRRRFAKEGPEKPKTTPEQDQKFAEELATRVRASRAAGVVK